MYNPLLIFNILYSFNYLIQSSSSLSSSSNIKNTKPTTATTTSNNFWHDIEQVCRKCQYDPPPSDILKQIQEQPWRGGLEPVPSMGIPCHKVEIIDGQIPADLHGMLCRNGPGRIRIGETQYGHWFDGDGLITQLVVDGIRQAATFQAKYVETDRFVAQQKLMSKETTTHGGKVPLAKSGPWTKRGSTGSRFENFFAIPTNPANTNVIFFPPKSSGDDDKNDGIPELYAISEGGDPVLMDSQTLETIGPKKITSASDETLSSKSFFSAHYTKDPVTNEIYNHGLQLSPIATSVNVMKLTSFGDLINQKSTELSSLCFIHDNALSENYFVLVVPPYYASQKGFFASLFGGDPLGKQFRWNEQGETQTTALIFSKETLDCVARIPLPLLSTYHFVDAFESEEGIAKNDDKLLTIRLLIHGPPCSERIDVEKCFSDLYRADPLPLCSIMEYSLDVESSKLVSSRLVAPDSRPCELPDVNSAWGYKKRYLYTNTREDHVSFTNSIQKVDMDTGKCSEVISFGDGVYCGGPTFVTKTNPIDEDDGYLFVYLYRSLDHGSDVCIVDAKTMEKLTLLRLESPVPYQFHGAWYPSI
jgi:all-trans-8'-apo-beta-carotenal 15,15'-oxygenase